jgi:molybdate transport system ATP-binding protein
MINNNLKVDIELMIGSVSLSANFYMQAEIVCIFGPSGSGKTSILNAIAGIKIPKKGSIILNNHSFFNAQKNINIPIKDRNIGYAFQDERLFPHMNVWKNLTYKSKDMIHLDEIINILDLKNILDRKIKNLSGGEKKRISLGRSLAGTPALLLLDEPLSGVEESRKKIILSFIKKLSLKNKIPILYVTHNNDEVKTLTNKVFQIKDGILKKLEKEGD